LVGRRFHAAGSHRHDATPSVGDTRVCQQPLNDSLRPFVLALAEVMIANASARIDEVESGPVLVLECAPDRIVVVDLAG